MREELDARLWNKHHAEMSMQLGRGAATMRRASGRVPMPIKLAGLVLVIGAVTMAASGPAAAQPAREAPLTVAVPYGDLNLGTTAGQQRLRHRIAGAARRLCQPKLIAPLGERTERLACFHDAVAEARAGIDRALARTETRGTVMIAAAAEHRVGR